MIENGRTATIDFLRQAQFDLVLPFTLDLTPLSEGEGKSLVCQRLLRLIPGKRMVCAGLWGGRRVVVKLFLDSRQAVRHWKRELKGVKALNKAGIMTPELLVAGCILAGALPLIIFAELQPVATLVDLWFAHLGGSPAQIGIRRELLKSAVVTIAEHHKAGLLQSDIHWSNFLFSEDKVFTIDGDAVDERNQGEALGREKSLANIALFLAESYPGIDLEIESVWQSYCQSRNWLMATNDIKQLKALTWGYRLKKADKYVAKSLRSCSAFACCQENHFYQIKDRAYQNSALDDLLEQPDALMAAGEVLKAGNSATVVRLNCAGLDLVVKRYNIKNFSHALRRGWRPSRAWVSWQNGQRLSWWRMPTPKPVAMREKRFWGWRSTAYFISEYIAGSNAFDFLRSPDCSAAERKAWLQQFSTLLQQLLELKISHGDFKATNFLCGSDGRLYLLDLDAMRYWPRTGPGFRRAVDRDYRRLLANWREEPELEREFRKLIAGLRKPW